MNKELLLMSRRASIPSRIAFLAAGTIVFVISYSIGAALPLSSEDAEVIRSEFLGELENVDESTIFLNNIGAALAMFVPGVGVGIGAYSGVSTGTVYNAFALISAELSSSSPLAILATPFGLLEVLAYGLAISRSGMLVAQLLKSRNDWRRFTVATLIEIGIVVSALVAGSLIESQVIESREI